MRAEVAACSYLTPFFSTVVSSIYLRVVPTIHLWLGCALIIAGSVLSWRSLRPGGDKHKDAKSRP